MVLKSSKSICVMYPLNMIDRRLRRHRCWVKMLSIRTKEE